MPDSDQAGRTTVVKDLKKKLREKILKDLRNQREEDRFRKSQGIQDRLFVLDAFQKAQTVMMYCSFDGEVETMGVIRQALCLKKTVVLPVILTRERQMLPCIVRDLEKDLENGPYGVQQPRQDERNLVALETIDLVVVPGVAFDSEHFRLGRGAGYYDRFLPSLLQDTPTVGLAFDFQIVRTLPRQEHDVPLTDVLSG